VPISFNEVPSNLRVPFVTAELDGSRAAQGPALLNYRALIIGMKLAAGSAPVNSLVKVTRADQLVPLAGRGSQIHQMAQAWFAANQSTELWCGILAEDAGGVAATGTVTIAGTPTAAGTLSLYVGGRRVAVPVSTTDTATTIAAAIVAAIGATSGLKDFAVRAGNVAGVVTLTAHHRGLYGNEIDVRVNYADGEALPAGITATVVAMASGTLNPVLTGLITAMGDQWFHVIANPFTDAVSLTALENELLSRSGPLRMIEGVAFAAKAGTFGTVAALGAGRNSRHSSIVRTNGSPTPPHEYAANVAAVTAYFSQIDPGRPLQTLPLVWVKAPPEASRDTNNERNQLLFSGISTTRVAAGDVVQIERLVTTYQLSAAGSPDPAYLDVTTIFTLMYLRFTFRTRMANRYPRHKLANDGTRFGAGQPVITPLIGKAEAVAWFREMEELGLVEGFDQFKRDLVVERNVSDANRLDFLLSPDLINQLVVGAAKVQFLL
jgi:phage tail sheath gpL-like